MCSTQKEFDSCPELQNQPSEHLKLNPESPTENWLAFLNVQVHLTHGAVKTRGYRKPNSKKILIHYLSTYPSSAKAGISRNMLVTTTQNDKYRQ